MKTQRNSATVSGFRFQKLRISGEFKMYMGQAKKVQISSGSQTVLSLLEWCGFIQHAAMPFQAVPYVFSPFLFCVHSSFERNLKIFKSWVTCRAVLLSDAVSEVQRPWSIDQTEPFGTAPETSRQNKLPPLANRFDTRITWGRTLEQYPPTKTLVDRLLQRAGGCGSALFWDTW